MTVNELIERLEEYRESVGGDAEVRLMTQQNWPFENSITGLCSAEEMNTFDGDDEDEDQREADPVVYIVENQQLGYESKRAWGAAY